MKIFSGILCVLCVLGLFGCDLPFGEKDPVVVSVGDRRLTQSELYRMVPHWDSLGDREKLAFLDHWIDEEVIIQEATDAKIMENPVLAARIESTVRKLVVDHYMQSFTDTMIVGDAEKLNYYQSHQDAYLRGKTSISGAILHFKNWASADAYYREMKSRVFNTVPAEHELVKEIVKFDTVSATPDSCLIPDIASFPIGKLSVMRYCNGSLKMAVVTERLDSSSVRPFADVADDVSTTVWIEHRNAVMERLKKEWKMKRPIFSKMDVFTEKEKQ